MEETPRRVMLVTPHPDDAEGGCGGTVGRWIANGAIVSYVMCTNGDKGSGDPDMTMDRLPIVREHEQLEAARVLGVSEVVFLRHPDGALEDNRLFRGEVVREIRRFKPEVVMCTDPVRTKSHTHRDHRVSGQVTVDAVCTYAWRPLYYPEHALMQGLEPHTVGAVYFWGSEQPNTFLDIAETIELKIKTLSRHVSQLSDPERVGEFVYRHAQRMGELSNLTYAEGFRVIRFNPNPYLAE